ncbi:Cytoplasmic dynein 2 light intermediate chain 1 [Nymphon striatum]|nr:Cytoplasmic dynein 2 light intermediate chain 1 [Nymphon striatum]
MYIYLDYFANLISLLKTNYMYYFKDESKNSAESTIFVIGNKQAGKSTLINKYLSKSEAPKPTVALEYVFARHGRGIDTVKDVCHIWELGGSILFCNLIEEVIMPQTILKCSIIIVIDLAVPNDIWSTVETLIVCLKSRIEKVLSMPQMKDSNTKEILYQATKIRIGEENMDFDSEKRKILCKGLRFLALTNGAALYSTSSKSESLLTRAKGVFSNLAFDLPSSKTFAVDHNKPLCIPFGTDSSHKIGVSSVDDGNDVFKSYDMWKNTFTASFPPSSKPVMQDDPAKDPNFAERDVDLMRMQKDKIDEVSSAEVNRVIIRRKKILSMQ